MAATWPRSLHAPFPGSARDVQGELTNMIATIGENMSLRRAASLSVSDGVVVAYTHNAVAPDLGKIGVLVALESTGDKAKLAALAKQLAMHVAADQSAVADRRRARPGRDRARARRAGREGRPDRQGGRHHRQDGRRRAAQVPPGSRAARAGLRHRRQDQGVEGRRRGRQAGRRAGPACRLSCASPWAKASRRSRKISPPRWLRNSRSSMNGTSTRARCARVAQRTD